MKKKDLTVEEMIMKSHYLNALEQESKAEAPCLIWSVKHL